MKFIISELEKANSDILEHHGILGQKWGKKQGPPYPLDAEDHSAKEKSDGYKKSIGGGKNEELYDRKTKKPESKEEKKQKFSDKEVKEYKDRLIEKYEKTNPDTAKFIKNLDDESIRADMQHKANIKKALIISAAVVGTSLAAYMVYKYRLNKTLDVAGKSGGKGINDLVKQGLSIDTASKIITVNAGGKLLDDPKIIKQIMDGLNNEMDVVIKDPAFAKVTFGKKLTKVHPLEYLSFTKKDASSYKRFLRDWEAELKTGIRGYRRNPIVNIFGTKEIAGEFKIPSTKKQSEIIEDLIAKDPSLLKIIEDSLTNLNEQAKKAHGMSPMPFLSRTEALGEINASKTNATVHSIINHNPILDQKISEAFRSKGYGGMIDLFDSKLSGQASSFTELPLIAFAEYLKLKP